MNVHAYKLLAILLAIPACQLDAMKVLQNGTRACLQNSARLQHVAKNTQAFKRTIWLKNGTVSFRVLVHTINATAGTVAGVLGGCMGAVFGGASGSVVLGIPFELAKIENGLERGAACGGAIGLVAGVVGGAVLNGGPVGLVACATVLGGSCAIGQYKEHKQAQDK